MWERWLSRTLSAKAAFDDAGFGDTAAGVDGVDGRDAGGLDVIVGAVIGCVVATPPTPVVGDDVGLGWTVLRVPLELDGPLIAETRSQGCG
jgi:hypothetical protein